MDTRSRVRLAIALLLVAAPLWGPALDVTGSDYVYRTAEVEVDGGEIAVDAPGFWAGPTDQIACLSALATADQDPGCYLQSRLRDGDVSVDYPGIEAFNGDPTTPRPRYVVFGTAGPVYERTLTYDHANGSFVYGLDRVDPETALGDVALDPERAPSAVGEALDTGEARRNEPLDRVDSGRIYSHEGEYVLVYEDRVSGPLTAQPVTERVFEVAAVLLGALLLFRVGRDTAAA
ncbi:hypothetical protein [Halobaculum marinum]|uniref:PGF-CTERM protein n=1 Tax=Halobaculum marinum TaxID=3031996 RepID=A0ABD5WVP2_9EURY|nr:hypothetical protein [Halobaculum sp. DT55]